MIKGILFDIDDTLFSHKIHAVPKLTNKLLGKLKEKGYKIGICTSRTVKEMNTIPKDLLDYIDCKIMGTGAITMVDNQYYKAYSIKHEDVRKYIDYFNEHNISYNYTDLNGDLFFYGDQSLITNGYTLSFAKNEVMFKEYEDEEITSLFYYGANEKDLEFINSVDEQAIISVWGNAGNINATYVDKSFGLLKFCQVYSFTTDEVVACGDGNNDDLMLEMAGIGIAVLNAKENTKQVADYICKKPNEEGGLYEAFVDLKLIKDDTRDIKMFFFDNDSTLFDHNVGHVREKTYETLQKLKDNGYKICLNTSRSFEECYNIPKELMNMMNCIILLNGAYVIRDGNVEVKYMNQEKIEKCMAYCKENKITCRYALDNGSGYLNQPDKDKEDLFYRLYEMTPPIKEYEGEKVIHLLYYAVGQQREEIKKILDGCGASDMKFGGEICPEGMSKGHAMMMVAEEYGYTADQICACGDGNNDIEMISFAGLGISMGNGTQELKNVADYVTDDISDEGIYNAMKHFGFIDKE